MPTVNITEYTSNVSVSLIILGVWYINNRSSKVNICKIIYNEFEKIKFAQKTCIDGVQSEK